MSYYSIYPKLPSAAKMYLEGPAATCQWRQGLLFLNLRVLMQIGFSRKAEYRPRPREPFFSQANNTPTPTTAVSLSIDRRL
jgi:hypothetical protein